MSDKLWGPKSGEQPDTEARIDNDEQPDKTAPAKKADSQRVDPSTAQASGREWRLIEKLILGLNAEQRRSRRWGIFFKSLTFIYLFALLFLWLPDDWWAAKTMGVGKHTALVEIDGTIAADEDANADAIAGALRDAFEDPATAGVILRINSPGGSPVQAGYVYDEVMRLKGLHPDIRVISVISDIGASGGYYIAAAADEIYANKASLVGSIGVVSSSFGFVEVLKKLGVERRLMTAGEHKAFLDPFTPLKDSEKAFWKEVLDTTHQQFIEQVKRGRGDRLADDERLFSGLIWTGEQALELGLVDGLGSAGYVAREVIGQKEIVDFTRSQSPLERIVDQFGTRVAETLALELGLKQGYLR